MIGSFLNVIIYRFPLMLNYTWHKQCEEYLDIKISHTTSIIFNLAWPKSHCIHCKNNLKLWHNIPILSFIFLHGRCAFCKEKISWQYPAIELMTAILAVILAIQYGVSLQFFAYCLLTYALICLVFIDLKQQLLPDHITLPFLWLGLFFNIFNIFCPLAAAVTGVIIAYCSLWIINFLFKLYMKKDGMGNGDFKLFALFGAWFGWYTLPLILFIAAASGMIVSIMLLLANKISRQQAIPFGPYLAIAGWLVGLWNSHYIIGL